MFMLDEVLVRCRVRKTELACWIDRDWVRPAREGSDWRFGEEDVARIQLICDLVYDLTVDPETLDIILPLVDQVYALRRSLLAMSRALDALPEDSRRLVLERLAGR